MITKSKGYTLIEILLVLTIVGILASFSCSILLGLQRNIRQQMIGDELRHRILLTRLLALHTGTPTTLCPSLNQKNCGGEWHQSQIIYQDNPNSTTFPSLLAIFPPLPKQESLVLKAYPTSEHLTFLPWGILKQQNGTFIWHKRDKSLAVIISKSGRVRLVAE